MIVSLFSAFAIPAMAAATQYDYMPVVLIGGGGEYNIVWKNNVNTVGYVTFSSGGKTYTYYDAINGVVRSDDDTHTVRVPQSLLDKAGSYTVHSAAVASRVGNKFTLNTSADVSANFTGYHNQEEIKFGFISDSHLEPNQKMSENRINNCRKYIKETMGGVDLVVLNGDIPNNMPKVSYFYQILKLAYATSDGTIPVAYIKGNHECRGYFAQKLYKYVAFNTNEFYCQWDYGPISVITCDIGEDKEDDHEEYYGVDDMDHYFDEQEVWLDNMGGFTEGSTYHISISHSPWFIDRYKSDEYASIIKNYGVDVHVCGHTHAQRVETNNRTGVLTIHDGGHNDDETIRTTLCTFKNGTYNFHAFDGAGGSVWEYSLKASNMGSSPAKTTAAVTETAEAPETAETEKTETVDTAKTETSEQRSDYVPTAAGLSTMSLKGAAAAVKITTKPVVFDCGYYYCVVWQTAEGNECAGYVEITKGSTKYSYMDSFAGKLRTETTHSVKIPKEILDGSIYYVRNRLVTVYAMYGKLSNPPTSYGPDVIGTQYKFDVSSTTAKKSYSVVAIGNTKLNASDLSNSAKTLKKAISGTPDLIVTLGNMFESVETESDFGNYLKYMNEVTDGVVPVMFVRGNGESTGAFAPYISRYIRNTTSTAVIGKYYLNSSYMDMTVYGLDTATSKADSEYTYAAFDAVRSAQPTWLKTKVPSVMKGKYNIAFSNASGIENYLGVNYTENFSKLGMNLVVSAGDGKASYKDGGSSYSTAICGSTSGDGTYGLQLNCSDDKITVTSIGTKKTVIGTVDVTKQNTNSNNNPTTPDKPDDNNSNGKGDDDNTGNNTSNNNNGSNNNNNSNRNNNTNNNTGTNTNNKPSGDTTTEYQPSDFDGIDGDIYVRTVEEGWYLTYGSESGFVYNGSAKPTADGKVTEAVFIQIVTSLQGVNLYLFDASTNAEKSSAWAEDCGVYSGYLGSDNILTDNVINTVISGLFAA